MSLVVKTNIFAYPKGLQAKDYVEFILTGESCKMVDVESIIKRHSENGSLKVQGIGKVNQIKSEIDSLLKEFSIKETSKAKKI